MAMARATIHKTIMGDKRVHFGTYTAASGDTSGTIDTELENEVEAFIMNGATSFTESGGVITFGAGTFLDPGATVTGGWMAVGR